MRDLGTLGGDSSYALGINDSGQVTGFSYLPDNRTNRAFIWTETGGMVDLGSLSRAITTAANAINSSGAVVGQGYNGHTQAPFYWTMTGGFVSLPPSASIYDQARGINDANYVIGNRAHGSFTDEAFIWDPLNHVIRYLGALPGGTNRIGFGLNHKMHATGAAAFSSADDLHGFLWTKTGGMQDIGAASRSQPWTYGVSINDQDEIVGETGPKSVPFYWSETTGIVILQSLANDASRDGVNSGRTQGSAYQITNDGTIVGNVNNAGGANRAVIWSSYNGAPQDLGTLPGGTNSYARSINSSGQVAGYSDVQ